MERDDSRVHWTDLPEFFNRFERDLHAGNEDGFFRVAQTRANRSMLDDAEFALCASPPVERRGCDSVVSGPQ